MIHLSKLNKGEFTMNYINNLKLYRIKANLTQEQVANALNIPRTQLVRYEMGKNEIPIRYLLELCKLYKVTPNEILSFSFDN